MKLSYLAILLLFLSQNLFAEKINVELDGKYVLSYPFLYSSIEIKDTSFSYNRGTDQIPDPWSEGFPINGKIEISGNLISLMHDRLDQDERRFRRVVDDGKHYLISDEDYSIWKKGKLDLRKSGHRKIKDEPSTGNSNAESSDINH